MLIQGPSGSGKELVARALHTLSPRKSGPYIKVNCAALPDNLLESELFGYVRGAFTDARRDKPGRFELAKGGTIFLDEIGDMSFALQSKLLRVIQDGEIQPLGSTKTVYSDARIIAATNKNLKSMVAEAAFREDLFYRLNVINIELPPLKSRHEDIPVLVDHFLNRFRLVTGKTVKQLSSKAMAALMDYDFPGNVRELENAIEHAFVLCKGNVIEAEHLPKAIAEGGAGRVPPSTGAELAASMKEQAAQLAYAAAIVGTTAYVIGVATSFFLPEPKEQTLAE